MHLLQLSSVLCPRKAAGKDELYSANDAVSVDFDSNHAKSFLSFFSRQRWIILTELNRMLGIDSDWRFSSGGRRKVYLTCSRRGQGTR
jgi:hypothetical protein